MHPYNIVLLPPTFKEAMHFSPLTSTWPNLKESRASCVPFLSEIVLGCWGG